MWCSWQFYEWRTWSSSDLWSWSLHHSHWQADLYEWLVHEVRTMKVQLRWLLLLSIRWRGALGPLWGKEMKHKSLWPLILRWRVEWSDWCWVYDHWIRLLGQSETEQRTLTHSEWTFDSDSVIEVVELQVVGLENLWVDLAVESKWVDPEDTLRYCKLVLDFWDDRWERDPDCRLFHQHWWAWWPDLILIPILILIQWPSGPLTFALWFGLSFAFWHAFLLLKVAWGPFGSFLSWGAFDFDLCLCPSWHSWSHLSCRDWWIDRCSWSRPKLHCWSSWREDYELETM